MRTGLLGGTFDPPHLAHLTVAAAARAALQLDRVLFVPAGLPWRKADRDVTAPAIRLRMVQAAVAGLSWADVSALELEREGPSYAVDTLRTLTTDGGDWWFIMGADALTDMPNWREPDVLTQLARLAVVHRGPGSLTVPAELLAAVPSVRAVLDVVPMPRLDISSTDLRRRLRDARPTDVLLPQPVRAVVDELGLYRD